MKILEQNHLKVPVVRTNYKRGRIEKELIADDPVFKKKFLKLVAAKPENWSFWRTKLNYLVNISPQYSDKYDSDEEIKFVEKDRADIADRLRIQHEAVVVKRKEVKELAKKEKQVRVDKKKEKMDAYTARREGLETKTRIVPNFITLTVSGAKMSSVRIDITKDEARKFGGSVADELWVKYFKHVRLDVEESPRTTFGFALLSIYLTNKGASKILTEELKEHIVRIPRFEEPDHHYYNNISANYRVSDNHPPVLSFDTFTKVMVSTIITKGFGHAVIPISGVTTDFYGLVGPLGLKETQDEIIRIGYALVSKPPPWELSNVNLSVRYINPMGMKEKTKVVKKVASKRPSDRVRTEKSRDKAKSGEEKKE